MIVETLNHLMVGQTRIKKELSYLIPPMRDGIGMNILLRGPSGYGKTHLAKIVAIMASGGDCNRCTLYSHYSPDFILEEKELRYVNILDEIHKLDSPEFLYHFMDKEERCFILCTNEYGELKEPLQNRCLSFNFEEYSLEDSKELIKRIFKKKEIYLSDSHVQIIAKNSRGNPREIHNICKKLFYIFKADGIPNQDDLETIIETRLGIIGGLNRTDMRYLNFLREQRNASIETLARGLNVPKSYLLYEIEPFLLKQGMITISSKGRMLNDNL